MAFRQISPSFHGQEEIYLFLGLELRFELSCRDLGVVEVLLVVLIHVGVFLSFVSKLVNLILIKINYLAN